MQVCIYCLERDEYPFYVGKTVSPEKREKDHQRRFGKDIKMRIIEWFDESEIDFWEAHYIHLYLSWDIKLENQALMYKGSLRPYVEKILELPEMRCKNGKIRATRLIEEHRQMKRELKSQKYMHKHYRDCYFELLEELREYQSKINKVIWSKNNKKLLKIQKIERKQLFTNQLSINFNELAIGFPV